MLILKQFCNSAPVSPSHGQGAFLATWGLDRRHTHPCLQCQVCRRLSRLWTLKQLWDSVRAPLSHGLGPVLPSQRHVQWLGRSSSRDFVGATPIHEHGNGPNVCRSSCGAWSRHLVGRISQHLPTKQGAYCSPSDQTGFMLAWAPGNRPTNYRPDLGPAIASWPGSNTA